MPTMNPFDNSRWEYLCSPDRLAFRAACNAVVTEAKRPLSRRVIARVLTHPDAKTCFDELPVRPDKDFYELLIESESWRTLVAETVDFDVRRAERVARFKEFLGWLVEKIKKITEEGPALAKGAAVAASCVLTVAVLQTKDAIKIPVVISGAEDAKPVVFTPKLDNDGIPIKLKASADPAKVSLAVNTDAAPLKLRLVLADDPHSPSPDALRGVSTQMATASKSLNEAAAALRRLNTSIPTFDVSELVRQVDRSTKALLDAYEKQAKYDNVAWDSRLRSTTELNLIAQQQVSATVLEHSATPVALPQLDSKSGSIAYRLVTICVGDIGGGMTSTRIKLRLLSGSDAKACDFADLKDVFAGPAVEMKDDLPDWRVAVSSIRPRLLHVPSARVTLIPFANKQPNTATTQSSSQETRESTAKGEQGAT